MNFCVAGAGAWGTAIAIHLARNGYSTTLIPRRYEHALELSTVRTNEDYLPGINFPEDLQVGCNLKLALLLTENTLWNISSANCKPKSHPNFAESYGNIILKKSFYISSNDNEKSLKFKTQKLEYLTFPEAIIKIFRRN